MRREDYNRSNRNSGYNYQRGNYQQPNPANQGPVYNNYGPQQPQQPYYPPRPHHHVVLWIVVILLCLGIGWGASEYFSQPTDQITNVSRGNKSTTNYGPKNQKGQKQSPKQTTVNQIQQEMQTLNVSPSDQQTAVNYFNKQSPANQKKIIKTIDMINEFVPSDAMKEKILSWILSK